MNTEKLFLESKFFIHLREKNWRAFAFRCLIIGSIQYLIFTAIAMFFYTGGNLYDSDVSNYDFFLNFFSDLGRVNALSGQLNLVSCLLFTITSLFLYSTLTVFILAFPSLFKTNKFQYNFIRGISIIGIVFIILAFCGTLIFWDVYPILHLIFANLYDIIGLIFVLLLTIAIFYNEDYPNRYGILLLCLFFFGIIYSISLIILPKSGSFEKILYQATMQKVSHYFLIACLLCQGYGALKLQKKIQS